MRLALALVFAVHGLAHLPGFLVPWRLVKPADMPYKTTLLGGSIDVGGTGIRIMGILWLLAAIGLFAAAVATFRGSPSWPTLALSVTGVSLVLSILAWPDSRIGVGVNLAILVALLLGRRLD